LNKKVFGIGFHKTGTKSLAVALSILGYRVTGPNGVNDPNISRNVRLVVCSLVQQYDAFQDNPWPILFEELDRAYPGSKFILTLRPTAEWIKSVVRNFGTATTPMREWIYGVGFPEGNEDIYISRYKQHNKEVIEYFHDRSDDFLIFRITEGEGWEKLCPFLNKDVPHREFPHANKAIDREGAR